LNALQFVDESARRAPQTFSGIVLALHESNLVPAWNQCHSDWKRVVPVGVTAELPGTDLKVMTIMFGRGLANQLGGTLRAKFVFRVHGYGSLCHHHW
jgi:hypothetical protein